MVLNLGLLETNSFHSNSDVINLTTIAQERCLPVFSIHQPAQDSSVPSKIVQRSTKTFFHKSYFVQVRIGFLVIY